MKSKCMKILSLLLVVMTLVGCKSTPKELIIPEVEEPEVLPLVTMEIKDFGVIQAELYPHIAPNTVNNFISLINKGFYNGITIHRIEKGFVLQGGDPTGTGAGGPGYSIAGEFTDNGFKNDLAHTEGVLSMARTQDKDSAGSQFFIVTKDAPHLDGQYASFGKVIKGMDVVHKIENVQTDANDKPVNNVVIESIKVDTKGVDYKAPDKIK